MYKKIPLAGITMAIAAILLFSACKKTNPSVVGTWQFSNYTTSLVSYNNINNDTLRTSYSYNPNTKTLTYLINRSLSVPHYDTITTTIGYSTWTIQANGAYTIAESTDTTSQTTTGQWNYLSTNTTNSDIVFNNGGSIFLNSSQPGVLTIQSVTDNKLVLTTSTAYTDQSGSFSNYNTVLTLSK